MIGWWLIEPRIHGLPAINWDNIDGPGQGETGLNDGGYCTHGLLSFPTWHRPYWFV